MASSEARVGPHLLIAGAVALGALVRLCGLSEQLLVSDEWHALHAAARASFGELFQLLTIGATSIPSNLYDELLLESVGWSEWTLRGPSVVAGVALVGVVPYLLRGSLGDRVAILSGYLLAVSPLLVFYSRYARPYSAVVLLTVIALLACHRWATTGRAVWAALFGIASVLAGWMHLLELRSLVLPLAAVLALRLVHRGPLHARIVPGAGAVVLVAAASVTALLALLLPAALSSRQFFFGTLERGNPTAGTLLGALELLAGTGRPAVALAAFALASVGLAALFRRDALLATLFAVVTAGDLAAVVLTRPTESQVPLVFARYVLPILPLGAVCAATALDSLARLAAGGGTGADGTRSIATFAALSALAVGGLILMGPLPAQLARPAGFANHKAYQGTYRSAASGQERYERFLALKSLEAPLRPVALSDFYRRLEKEPGDPVVIEYPVIIGDVFSTHFVAQELHGRRVLGGYVRQPAARRAEGRPGVVFASMPIDTVLGEVQVPERLRFASLVDLADVDGLRRSGARYLIAHRSPVHERRGQAPPPRTPVPMPTAVRHGLLAAFGQPVFADEWVTVFRLRAD